MTAKKTTVSDRRKSNEILEDHGDWLLIDISTPKHPDATMAVDADVFEAHEGGRILALHQCKYYKYILSGYNKHRKFKLFHKDVIESRNGYEIDHKTHGSMSFIDNRRSNLRLVTRSQNSMNRSKRVDNSSGVPGVHFANDRGLWCARINIDGKRKVVGYYENLYDAVTARNEAMVEHYGDFAFKGGE